MKVVIFGNEKGLFSNLVKWLNAAGHEACMWGKFFPEGNKATAKPCPITDPDIILMVVGGYITYEDLPKMGITTKPKRVYFNLGNKDVSRMTKDWRIGMFCDKFVSYNPEHKNYQVKERANRFADLKCLPLPFDYTKYQAQDYSNATLKVCQTLSDICMSGVYSKQTEILADVCKSREIPCDLIFEETGTAALARKKQSPVLFDNLMGMFGTTSHEAWSLGQAVICHVEQSILDEYALLLGAPPPVIQASNLVELELVADKLKSGEIDWKAKCIESRQYMENYYNPTKLTNVYINYFNSILEV
jgi:hypothetical protein